MALKLALDSRVLALVLVTRVQASALKGPGLGLGLEGPGLGLVLFILALTTTLLGIPSIEWRRLRGDMIETDKILTGKEYIETSNVIKISRLHNTCTCLQGHKIKIQKQQSRLDIRKYFFSQRVVNQWNKLSQNIMVAPSINCFKNVLEEEWRDMDARIK